MAVITSPSENEEIKDALQIRCTVIDDVKLDQYKLYFYRIDDKIPAGASDDDIEAFVSASEECMIAEGSEEISDALLAEYDLNELEEVEYSILLAAWDKAGNCSLDRINISVIKEEITTDDPEENTTEDKENDVTDETGDSSTEESEEPATEETTEPENPDDITPPVVAIISPENDDILTTPSDVTGSVYDETELLFWRLEYKAVDSSRNAEVNAISRAINDGANLDGATISVANVRSVGNYSGLYGTSKPPCDVCQPLLDYYGIEVVN